MLCAECRVKTASRNSALSTLALLILCLSLGQLCHALDPSRSLQQYLLDSWQIREGLPQNTVQAIVQTRDGYLWIGTQEGLARFDGVQFTIFDKRNTPAFQSHYILTLLEDSAGRLWIGTNSGLLLYHDGKFSRFTAPNAPSDQYIRNLYMDSRNRLWIGTDLGGLNLYHGGRFSAYTTKNGLSHNFVRATCLDRSGNLWVGTDGGGLNRMRDGKWEVERAVTHFFIGSILEDRSGRLWVGTLGGGLFFHKDGKWNSLTTKDGLPNNFIRYLYEDDRGTLWIATEGGLARNIRGQWQVLTNSHGLASPFIWTLTQDHEGSLWIGTFGGGLSRLKDPKFLTLTSQQGLSDDDIWSIHGDQNGVMWIGTVNGGVTRWNNGQTSSITTGNGLPNNNVRSILVDRDGTVWIGTSGGGLCAWRDGKCTIYNSKNGLSNDFVRSIYQDQEGNLWIGTNGGGLNRFRDGKFTFFDSRNGLSGDFIRALHQDRQGNLWIAVDGGGVVRYNKGEFKQYGLKEGISSDKVLSLYQDPERTLWIGTLDGGLNRLKDEKFTSYKIDNGLADDGVFQILEDATGHLWMGSNKGIFRVAKKELNDYAAGKIKKISSDIFGIADGMASNECNGGSFPSGWKDSTGRLWFPTDHGVVVFDPDHLPVNQLAPRVHIESLIADDAAHLRLPPFGKQISFEPGITRLEFHYTALSFLFPQKMKFQYRLDGFDKDWVQAGSRRVAYYTNLPPGRYTFRVIASNNDGVWNHEGAFVLFELSPHFYQTFWFYALCVLALILLIVAVYRFRIRQMRLQFAAVLEERNRISREIHDTLTQDFTAIVLQLEAAEMVMENTPEHAGSFVERARELARNGLTESRRFVQALRPSPLEGKSLSNAFKQIADKTLSGSGIKFSIEVAGKEKQLQPGVEDNLLRIAQEAFTNIRKHSGAQNVKMHLHYKRLLTEMRIEDDGHGFDPQNPSSSGEGGFGLTSMRERAAQAKGRLEIHSAPGKGTSIVVSVSKF